MGFGANLGHQEVENDLFECRRGGPSRTTLRITPSFDCDVASDRAWSHVFVQSNVHDQVNMSLFRGFRFCHNEAVV